MTPRSSLHGPRRLHIVAFIALLVFSAHHFLTAALFTEVVQPIRADAADYVSYAYNLEHFGVYSRDPTWFPGGPPGPAPDAVRTPGYPMLLAVLLGDQVPSANFVLRATVFQALLAVLVVAASFALARRFLPFAAAMACALLVAITPQFVTSVTYLLSEVWFALWVVVALLALVRGSTATRGAVAWIALAGVLLGISALVRPTTQYLPLLLAPALAIGLRGRGGVRAAAALLVGFVVAFGPWIARNEVTLGIGSDPTITIGSMHHGSYPEFTYPGHPESYGYPYRFDPKSAEITRSVGTIVAHIVARFREDPWPMFRWYVLEKPFYLFAWDPIQGDGDVYVYPVSASPYRDRLEFRATRFAMLVVHWPLMLLGMAGAALALVPRARLVDDSGLAFAVRLLGLTYAYVIAVHVAAAPFPRYSVPFRPLTLLFALLVIVRATRALRVAR